MLTDKFDDYLKSFQPSRILFEENQPGDHFYLIKEGLVDVFKNRPSGEEMHLSTLGPGELVGEMALVRETARRTATARTKTPVQAWNFTKTQFEGLLEKSQDFRERILRMMVERLNRTNDAISETEELKDLLYRSTFLLLYLLQDQRRPGPGEIRVNLSPSIHTLAQNFGVPADTVEALLGSSRLKDLYGFAGAEQEEIRRVAKKILQEGLENISFTTNVTVRRDHLDLERDYTNLNKATQAAENLLEQVERLGSNPERAQYERIREEYDSLRECHRDHKTDPTVAELEMNRLEAYLDEIRRFFQDVSPGSSDR